jgi:AcrR family transcriptional regulator
MAENGRLASLAIREEKQTSGIVTLILALACGDSVRDAARAAGIPERTVYRRLRTESFVQRVNQARTAMLQQAVGRLSKSVTRAGEALDRLLDSESERIRLQAAKAIIDCALKLGDSVSYEQRLATLEDMLNMRLPRRERQHDRDNRRQW